MIKIEGTEYMKNPRGDLVPLENVKPVDVLRDQTVKSIISKAMEMSGILEEFKKDVFEEAEEFVNLSFEEYGQKYGGKKGNITLTSYDGEFKVSIEMQDVISFDEQLQVAKSLIDQCIHKWSGGANANLRVLVNDAFQVDKAGNVNTRRILELRRLEIEDDDWQAAMDAISSSIKVLMSRRYMRIYRKNSQGDGYSMIPLDFASI